jgi:hypothetical protein
VDAGYSHRWFHGVQVTDNINRSPSDYVSYTLTAPTDSRLAGGGGYPIKVYVPTNAAANVAAQSVVTFQKDFGAEQDNHYDGVDITLNARLKQGLTLQMGSTTGRSIVDACATGGFTQSSTATLPTAAQVDSPDLRSCRAADPFQTTVRGLAAYTIPKIGVLVSVTARSQPVQARTATWNVPNSVITNLLGFLPSGSTAAGTTAFALQDADHRIWDDSRRTQVDMRLAKVLRFGRTRSDIGIDLTNLLNSNYATAWDNTYQYGVANGGTWNNASTVYTPRFARLNFTVSF